MKKIAWMLVITLLLIGGYFGYLFFFKSYDTADEEVDQLADEEYEVSLPVEKQGQSPTEEEIVSSYRASYDAMIAEAENRRDQMITEAQQEFMSKKKNGEEISYGYFFSKYKSAADRLEESTDHAFEKIYQPMKSSLQNNGYGVDAAESLKKEYEQTKKRWRSELMEAAKNSF